MLWAVAGFALLTLPGLTDDEERPPAAVPRFFSVLDAIPLGDNLKTELG